jgi:hypothetical protein
MKKKKCPEIQTHSKHMKSWRMVCISCSIWIFSRLLFCLHNGELRRDSISRQATVQTQLRRAASWSEPETISLPSSETLTVTATTPRPIDYTPCVLPSAHYQSGAGITTDEVSGSSGKYTTMSACCLPHKQFKDFYKPGSTVDQLFGS